MTRQWPRFPLQAGVICLVVLGALLLRVGTRSGGPETVESILFLFATLGVALSVALVPARAGVARPWALRLITLVAAAILLATALGLLVAEPDRTDTPRDQLGPLARGRETLMTLPPAMGRTALRLETLVDTAWEEGEDLDGGLFRILAGVGEIWRLETGGELTMEPGAVLWRDGERVAWSPGAEPLELAEADRGGPVSDPPADRRLTPGRHGWFLQQVTPLDSGLGLELQVPLTGTHLANGDRGWIPSVVAQPRTETFVDDEGRLSTDLVLAGTRGGAVRLSVPGSGAAEGLIRWRSRLLLVAVISWLVTLLGFSRLALGQAWVLAALWVRACARGRGRTFALGFRRISRRGLSRQARRPDQPGRSRLFRDPVRLRVVRLGGRRPPDDGPGGGDRLVAPVAPGTGWWRRGSP